VEQLQESKANGKDAEIYISAQFRKDVMRKGVENEIAWGSREGFTLPCLKEPCIPALN
jgi:hypothetical protein